MEILKTKDGLPIAKFVDAAGQPYYAVRAIHRINAASAAGLHLHVQVNMSPDWLACLVQVEVVSGEDILCTEVGLFSFADRGASFVNAGVTITKSKALATLGIGSVFPDELGDAAQFAGAEEIQDFLAKTGNLLTAMKDNPKAALAALAKADGPEESKAALAAAIQKMGADKKTSAAIQGAVRKTK